MQISISTPEKQDIEGDQQQPAAKTASIAPKPRKKVAPTARKDVGILKDYLLTKARLRSDQSRIKTATLIDATYFAKSLSGEPIIEKVVPQEIGKSFKMTVRLPQEINLDALLIMWNHTLFTDVIFTVVEYEIVIE